MVCGFCKGQGLHNGKPAGNHNVRTCDVLKTTALLFMANKGTSFMDLASFTAEIVKQAAICGCAAFADVCGGGGAFTAAQTAQAVAACTTAYDLYGKASAVIDVAAFLALETAK